jgi:hypothetical protein
MAIFNYDNASQDPGIFTFAASQAAISAVAPPFGTGDQLNAKAINDVLIVVHYSVAAVVP